MKVTLLSILLLGMIPCIPATGYDRQTLLESANLAGERVRVFKVFDRIDQLLGQTDDSADDLMVSLREKLLANTGNVYVTKQEGEEINEAVELLEFLDTAQNWCDLDGYLLLMGAYLSATHKSGRLDAASPTSRLVIKALERHGQACRPQYSIIFADIERTLNRVDKVHAGKVDRVLSPDVIDSLFPHEDLKVRVRATDIVPDRFVAHVSRSLFLSKLDQAARRTADKIDVNSNLSDRDLERHLIEPCQSYIKNYRRVFLPARLDLALDEDKISQINPLKNSKFNETWIKFRVCSALVVNSEKVLELINQKLSKDE